jgi:hypothetical protein
MFLHKITYNSLFEDVQQAKDYLFKISAKKMGKKPSDLDDEIKKRILTDPLWIAVRDLTQKTPGYTFMFTKFAFDEHAPMSTLEEILSKLTQYKQILGGLPMKVEQYSKIEPSKEDHRPGYERLDDDLVQLERKRAVKDLYNEFTSKLKDDFKGASPDQVNALVEITNQAKSKGEDCWRNLLGWNPETKKYNLSRYDNLQEFIEFATKFIEQYGKGGEGAFEKEIKELGAQVGVFYNEGDYLAVSVRTSEAQQKLFGDLSWCITRSTASFWGYSGGNLQINVFNFSLPITDKMYVIGMTVSPQGKITDAFDKFNNRLVGSSNKPFWEYLAKEGYPKTMVEKMKSKFPDEVRIRKSLEAFQKYRETGGQLGAREVIRYLVGLTNNVASGIMTPQEWEEISGEVSKIIFDDMGFTSDTFLDFFKENGIYSDSAWNVFHSVVGEKYTKQDMESIIKATNEGFETFQDLIEFGALKMKKVELDLMKKALAEKEEILDRARKQMK